MTVYYTGEHEGIRWRAVVEGRRVTIQAGDASRTYKQPETVGEAEATVLAKSLIRDSIDGPYRA